MRFEDRCGTPSGDLKSPDYWTKLASKAPLLYSLWPRSIPGLIFLFSTIRAVLNSGSREATVESLSCNFGVDLVTQGVAHIDEALHRAVLGDLVCGDISKDFLAEQGDLVQEHI